MRKVANGDYVTIHYTGKFTTGDVFDSSAGQDPLAFSVGSQELIQGMNDAVMGMVVGEKKTVSINPENAYGAFEEKLLQKVPKSSMPEDIQKGDQLMANTDDGQFPVWVKEIASDHVIIDGNHPLAGQTLIFDIEVMNIQDASARPAHVHGPGCHH